MPRLIDQHKQVYTLRPTKPERSGKKKPSDRKFKLAWHGSTAPDTTLPARALRATAARRGATSRAPSDLDKPKFKIKEKPGTWIYKVRSSTVVPADAARPSFTVTTPFSKRSTKAKVNTSSGDRHPWREACRSRHATRRYRRAAMSTCVVTGGAGFLGSHLCEALLGQGHRVICLDNLDTGSLRNISHIRDENFVFANLDITERVEIDEPVDFVYHLASPASPIDYARLPLHTLKVGSYGTHHMLGVAKFKRARFLLASTSEVYGDPQIHPQPESYWGHVNPIGPRGVYDEAKRYAEALTMAYHRQQGVDTTIVRIFNTYGPRMRAHDGRAIPTFLRQALQDKPLTVFGDGSQTRSFCFVDDLVRGLVALMESDAHSPINIGNPDEYTLLQLAETVVEATGSKSEIVFEALPVDDPQVRQPDITQAREVLGWEPRSRSRTASSGRSRNPVASD